MKELFDVDGIDSFIESKDVLDFVTQVEKENSQIVPVAEMSNDQPSTSTEKSVSKSPKKQNIQINQVANVTRQPMMPHMLFPHSNVTINYHIYNAKYDWKW